MDTAALIISFVAMAGTTASAIVAWFARADSLRAGAEAAVAAERATVATEKMAAIQARIFDGPPWSTEWMAGDTFLLTNMSPVDAERVVVSSDPQNLRLTLFDEFPMTIGARSAIRYMYSATMGHGPKRDILVEWSRPGSEERLNWRFPLPSRSR